MARAFNEPSHLVANWDTPLNLALSNLDGRLLRRGFDVMEYGAAGNGLTDDAAAITAAVADAHAVGGGVVYFPAGTYLTTQTITIYSNISYLGAGPGATTIKLANGSNVDLMATDQFASLHNSNTQAGPTHFGIHHMTLDGNRANQSSGYVLSTYGTSFLVEWCRITGGKSGGWRSQWATGGAEMEASIHDTRLVDNSGIQLDWQGPHDSQFHNIIVNTNAATLVAGSKGIVTSGNAVGEQFTNLHIWGYHVEGLTLGTTATVYNGVAEGAQVNVWFNQPRCIFQGTIFGTGGGGPAAGTEVGLRLGTASTIVAEEHTFGGSIFNWAVGDHPIEFADDGGGIIHAHLSVGTATAAWFGTKSFNTELHIVCADNPALCEAPVFTGPGVPFSGLGVVGSYYHRTDGTTNSRIYHKTAANTWTAIL